MQFIFIDELGITTNLIVLEKRTEPYSTLLYQHEGTLSPTPERFGNLTPEDNALKAVIGKAIDTDVDLLLIPEYCCPWNVINWIIEDQSRWPADNKLWIIGAESINKQELRDFNLKNNTGEIFTYFEQNVLTNNKNFLDPLVHIFRGRNNDVNKLIILIQFKTMHMGVWTSPMESENCILGRNIYILRNSPNSIRFFSLICSEAMNFNAALTPEVKEKLDWDDKAFLIFNPQLNPDPTYNQFCNFRKEVLSSDKKELITLNWSSLSKIKTKPLTRQNSSRSGFWVQSQEINLQDNHIKTNHNGGIYYFTFGANKHCFILNSCIHAYQINNWPVHITAGTVPQRRRPGPQILATFTLNTDKNTLNLNDESVSDGHLQYLNEIGCTSAFLLDPNACILEKEILVCLTNGKVKGGKDRIWNSISELYSWKSSQQTENNFRISYTEDHNDENEKQRTDYLDSIRELEHNVLSDPKNYPACMDDLKNEKLKVAFVASSIGSNYRYNVCTTAGDMKFVTLAFLNSPRKQQLIETYDNLRSLFEPNDRSRERVIVFFRSGTDIGKKFDETAAKISVAESFSEQSILNTGT